MVAAPEFSVVPANGTRFLSRPEINSSGKIAIRRILRVSRSLAVDRLFKLLDPQAVSNNSSGTSFHMAGDDSKSVPEDKDNRLNERRERSIAGRLDAEFAELTRVDRRRRFREHADRFLA